MSHRGKNLQATRLKPAFASSRKDSNCDPTPSLDFLWLEITGKCNLECSHCYADSGPLRTVYGRMQTKDWIKVLDGAAELNCRQVQFIGGEPTLHPGLPELIRHADECGFTLIEVFTNATRLTPALMACFQRHHVSIATSFYSDDPEIHDRITMQRGSWRSTVSGIKQVLQGRLPLRVGLTEMEENAGQMHRTTAFLQSLGVRQFKIDRRRGIGRSDISEASSGERFDELCGQCWKGKLCVTPSGDVFPCVFSRATRIGNIQSGLQELVGSEPLMDFRRIVRDRQTVTACHPSCNPPPGAPDCGPCGPLGCDPNTPCVPDACSPDRSPEPEPCHPETHPW